MVRRGALSFVLCFWATTAWGEQFFRPKGDCDQVVVHDYYDLCYSSRHRQALWTTHELTRDSIYGKTKRRNSYRADHSVQDPVSKKDYKRSGYDRGHLVPAADMKLNRQAMSQSFYMTNMSPQDPALNRRIWAELESDVRDLVKRYGDGYVVTAPILGQGLARIKSGVSIPEYFYKIIYIPEADLMMAWILENRGHGKADLDEFLISVDELEELTGFDFFSELPDDLEKRLESQSGL